MTNTELIKKLFLSFNDNDNEAFMQVARECLGRNLLDSK